jgi:hypothetical protein
MALASSARAESAVIAATAKPKMNIFFIWTILIRGGGSRIAVIAKGFAVFGGSKRR